MKQWIFIIFDKKIIFFDIFWLKIFLVNFCKIWQKFKLSYNIEFFERSEDRRPERSSEFCCPKNKNNQTKQYGDLRTTHYQFCTCQTIHFLSKFLTFLSLFQSPKTFPHVLNYHNLSKRRSEKMFFEPIFFFQKQLFIFFFRFCFFSNFFFRNVFEFCFFLNFFFLSVSSLLLVFVFFWKNKQRTL
jgi:hypothetical protein